VPARIASWVSTRKRGSGHGQTDRDAVARRSQAEPAAIPLAPRGRCPRCTWGSRARARAGGPERAPRARSWARSRARPTATPTSSSATSRPGAWRPRRARPWRSRLRWSASWPASSRPCTRRGAQGPAGGGARKALEVLRSWGCVEQIRLPVQGRDRGKLGGPLRLPCELAWALVCRKGCWRNARHRSRVRIMSVEH